MSRDWKPGDVAMARLDSETEIRVMFLGGSWIGRKGTFYDLYTSARPLVVIDPEDPEQVERLAHEIAAAEHDGCGSLTCFTDRVQAALLELANPTPAKPDEPTDPAARVRSHGCLWAKVGSWWTTPVTHELPRNWAYLVGADDVEVVEP